MQFTTFADLLATPSEDAGFYLGVKAAFEALLWRVESEEGNRLCVPLREPAVRYLELRLGEHADDEEADPTMVDVYKASMSPEEAAVVALLEDVADRRVEGARKAAAEEASASIQAASEKLASTTPTGDEVVVAGDEADDASEEGAADAAPEPAIIRAGGPPPEAVAPGFARSRPKIVGP